MMIRLQHRKTSNPAPLVSQRDANNASGVCAVLNAEQVAIVPIKPINPTRYYSVRLRQSCRCTGGSVDPSDSSRQCNVQDSVAAQSDSVSTANSARLA